MKKNAQKFAQFKYYLYLCNVIKKTTTFNNGKASRKVTEIMIKTKFNLVCKYTCGTEDKNPTTITHTFADEKQATKLMEILVKTDGVEIEMLTKNCAATKDNLTGGYSIYEIHPFVTIE